MVKFMKKQNAPAFTPLTAAEVDDFKTKEAVVVVGHFADLESAEAKAFAEAANKLRNEYSFGAVTEGVTSPSVTLYNADGPQAFDGEYTVENLEHFVVTEAFPLFGEIGPDNYHKYASRGFPLVWFFLDYSADITNDIVSFASEIAKDLKGKLSLVKLDGIRWSQHAKNYGLSGNAPGIVIEDRVTKKNYVLPEKNAVTSEALRAHLQGYVDGTLAPYVKSEEIPADNDGPVTAIVGTNFEQVVMDKTKDVFVEFYAPWCGHCKSLAPKWDELGSLFADNENVVIGKMDSTANDAPGVEVKGFPSLYLFKADDKTPLRYHGERTPEAMAKWVRETGSTFKNTGAHDHDEL